MDFGEQIWCIHSDEMSFGCHVFAVANGIHLWEHWSLFSRTRYTYIYPNLQQETATFVGYILQISYQVRLASASAHYRH